MYATNARSDWTTPRRVKVGSADLADDFCPTPCGQKMLRVSNTRYAAGRTESFTDAAEGSGWVACAAGLAAATGACATLAGARTEPGRTRSEVAAGGCGCVYTTTAMA